jgi:5,10-methylenetetrahydromethanopterin reductase
MLGAVMVSTERVELGPGVAHLAGRHPSVIASALATLAELGPGRVRLGIGVGDSGPQNLGLARASLRELEAAVRQIRGLLEGELVEGDHALRLSYAPPPRPVPIYVAGGAERAHRLSGRVADGALISTSPAELSGAVAAVRAGEREAGRPAGSTKILLWTTVAVDLEREVARAAIRGSVARRALNALSGLARRGQLDPEDAEPLERLRRAHDAGEHADGGFAPLVPERWIDRFAMAGTPDEVGQRIERALADGADEVSMILIDPRGGPRGSTAQLKLVAEQVIAPLRQPSR